MKDVKDMKGKSCLPQLPQLQSYVLVVLAVSLLCNALHYHQINQRPLSQEMPGGKGPWQRGAKGCRGFCRGSLSSCSRGLGPSRSFMVFPHVFSSYKLLMLYDVIVVLLVEAFWYHGLWSPLGTWRAWKPPLPVLTLSSNDWCPLCSFLYCCAAVNHLMMKFKPELESQ